MQNSNLLIVSLIALAGLCAGGLRAQSGTPAATSPAPAAADRPNTVVVPPPDYVIGPDDALSVVFWKDKDLSGDVVVRPDGRISLPLLNDIQASGLTVDQLRANVTTAATKYIESPTVTVIVRQINSRKVFITGQVAKPGAYALGDHMTVIQLIALAGGLTDYADKDNIVVIRNSDKGPDGTPHSYRVNYSDVTKRRKVSQDIELKAGDTVIVP